MGYTQESRANTEMLKIEIATVRARLSLLYSCDIHIHTNQRISTKNMKKVEE